MKNQRQNQKKNTSNNQVRIVGGQFKRRNLTFIEADGLRPTPDRMRETLFNWLMFELNDAKVLDACAGSGVLGFETLSRGATKCIFIEANKQQVKQLHQSAQALKLTTKQATIIHGMAEEVMGQIDKQTFNLVFLDPPYSLNLWQPILDALIKHNLIDNHTLIYIEADKPMRQIFASETVDCIEILKEKNMGQVTGWLVKVNI